MCPYTGKVRQGCTALIGRHSYAQRFASHFFIRNNQLRSVCSGAEDRRPRALMIMGFAASLDGWKPQLLDMLTPHVRASQPSVPIAIPFIVEMCLVHMYGSHPCGHRLHEALSTPTYISNTKCVCNAHASLLWHAACAATCHRCRQGFALSAGLLEWLVECSQATASRLWSCAL